MDMAAPRIRRIPSAPIRIRSVPSSSIFAASTRPGGVGTRPINESAVTLFPDPDSPTSPTMRPRPTSNDTSSRMRTVARGRRNSVHRPRTLIAIKDWDYNWQETYWFQEPVKVAKETRLEIEAVFDNSDKNPNNPFSPPRPVIFGEQTTNEMCFGFLGATSDQPGRIKVRR